MMQSLQKFLFIQELEFQFAFSLNKRIKSSGTTMYKNAKGMVVKIVLITKKIARYGPFSQIQSHRDEQKFISQNRCKINVTPNPITVFQLYSLVYIAFAHALNLSNFWKIFSQYIFGISFGTYVIL